MLEFNETYKIKIYKKIIKYCEKYYTKVDGSDFLLGELRYNQKCHLNAVQNKLEKKSDNVYLAVCVDKGVDTDINIHFINKKGDNYLDSTFGWASCFYVYYICRKIEEDEYKNIRKILIQSKKDIFNICSNKILNKILFFNYDII